MEDLTMPGGISKDIARHEAAAKAAQQQAETAKAQNNQANGAYQKKLDNNTKKIDNAIQSGLNGVEQKYQEGQQGIGDFFDGLKADEKTGNEGKNLKGAAGVADKVQRGAEKVYNKGVGAAKAVVKGSHTVATAGVRASARVVAGAAKVINHVDTAQKKVRSAISHAAKNGYENAKAAVKSGYHKAVAGGQRLLKSFVTWAMS